MPAVRLKRIERSLREIDHLRRECNHFGGAAELAGTVSPALRTWEGRADFFDTISSDLNDVSQETQSEETAATIKELHIEANMSEHFLNVVMNDKTVPSSETNASIRFVVENEEMLSSPLIQEALIDLAINDEQPEVRRFSWLHICRYNSRKLTLGDRTEHGNDVELDRWKTVRKQFLRKRTSFGPRGTILIPATLRSEARDLINELLRLLARPTGIVERTEVPLTLGELGGAEVALFLTDALRCEINEHSKDEEYQVYLTSALLNLGGEDSVEALLNAAEYASEPVRLAALSGLEALATSGAVSLTEYSEPAMIDSDEMRDAYEDLSNRLSVLMAQPSISSYVKFKVEELLDSVRISLSSAEVLA